MKPLHHHLIEVALSTIRPTQVTVGYIEVQEKRKEWESLAKSERKQLIDAHWFPSILGPSGQYFIVDHHHLGLALHQEGHEKVRLTVLEDLSWLELDLFWRVMEFKRWVHPFDAKGARVSFQKIPKSIAELKDDPYRSLVGLIRKRGGFAKDETPYSEFLWADYFRDKIQLKLIQSSMEQAIELGLGIAKLPQARYLPGWVSKDASIGDTFR